MPHSAPPRFAALLLVCGLAACNRPSPGPTAEPGPEIPEANTPTTPEALPALEVTVGPGASLCPGESLQLSASAAGGDGQYTFLWTADPDCPGCISDPQAASPTVLPAASATYTVTVRDGAGATAQNTVPVVVHPAAVAYAGPIMTIDPSVAVTLGGPASSADVASWTCNRADCALSDAASPNPVAQPTLSTHYTLSVTNPSGCTATSQTTLWVNLRVLRTYPEDGEMGWPVTARLMVEFDQPLDPASLTEDTLYLTAADGARVPLTTSVQERFLVVTPGAGYAEGQDYTLTLAGGPAGLRTADEVLPNRLSGEVTLEFTTGGPDTLPPQIVYRTPAAGAWDVPSNAVVLAVFDEPLDPLSVQPLAFRLGGASGDLQGAFAWDPATRAATLQPAAELAVDAVYTVTVSGLSDLSGNVLTTGWSFNTGPNPDLVPPEVLTVTPAPGATGVSGGDPVTVTFSEVVILGDLGTLTVTRTSDQQPLPGVLVLNPASMQATWTPSAPFESQTEYQLTVSGFRDLAGNVMAAPFVSTFTSRQILFADFFNKSALGPEWAAAGGWGLASNGRYHSASGSLADSPVGRYLPGANGSATAQSIDVSGLSALSISFWSRGQSERNGDFFTARYRLDGGPWVELVRSSGNRAWVEERWPIDPTGHALLDVQFVFQANDRRERDGVYVDDLLIQSP